MICPECDVEMEPVDHNGRGYRCGACWAALPEMDEAQPAPDSKSFDIENATVDEVLQAIEDGDISAIRAWQAENEGKARKTLLKRLDDLYLH